MRTFRFTIPSLLLLLAAVAHADLPVINPASLRPIRMGTGTAAIGCGVRITGAIANGGYTVALPASQDAAVDAVVYSITATTTRTTNGVLVGQGEVQLKASSAIAIDDLVAIADTQGRWGPASRLQRNVVYVAKQAAAMDGLFWARPIAGEARSRRFFSGILTGTGVSQNTAHGLGSTPTSVLCWIRGLPAGTTFATAVEIADGTHTATNVVATVPTGVKYQCLAEVY